MDRKMLVIKEAVTALPVRLNARLNLKLAVAVTLSVFLILTLVRWIWKIPKPLLIVIGLIFLVWSVVFWGLRRKAITTAPLAVAFRQVTPLLSAWLLTSGLLLGLVYHFDRAGWLWFQLTGYNVTLAEDFPNLADLSSLDFVARYPVFVIDAHDSTGLILPKGVYDFGETIIVPRGTFLTIEPGTVLRFGAGRSLISYSPVIARGTESAPILFTAQNKWLKWGVVGVVKTGQSVFEQVRFEYGRQALVNSIDFPGSLSLIETDVEIRHSQFVNLFGKDGVYVRQAHVLIQDNIFNNTFKDGVDLDGAAGEISHNQFINCNDEGIDLSENYDVEVFDNTILDRRGGRIAADNNLELIMSLNTLGYSGDNRDKMR